MVDDAAAEPAINTTDEQPVTQDQHALDALHASLSCPICATWLSAPLLLTVCGHSFCAACIRQNFDYQERTTVKEGGRLGCPLCRKACDRRELVANVVLRDVVGEYRKVEGDLRGRLERVETKEKAIEAAMVRESQLRTKRRKTTSRGDDIEERDIVCLDDELGSDDGQRSASSDASSSEEEYDPRGDGRGRKGPRGAKAARRGKVTTAAVGTGTGAGTTMSSFLACPICGKNVHHMYMNSHVDACLSGGNGAGAAMGRSGNDQGGGRAKTSQHTLEVPPKLVLLGALSNPSNEKKLKSELKKYNISTEGCASARELLDRYMRFRTAVEVSNDKGEEGASYEKIVFRLMKEERSKKMAGMFGGKRTSKVEDGAAQLVNLVDASGALGPSACIQGEIPPKRPGSTAATKEVIDMTVDGTKQQAVADARGRFDPSKIDLSKIRHPREILLPEDATFEEMVAVTRVRDKVRAMLLQEFNQSE